MRRRHRRDRCHRGPVDRRNAARLHRPAPSGLRGRDRRHRGGTPAGDDHRQGTGRIRAVVGELVLSGRCLHLRRPGRRGRGRLRPSAAGRDRRQRRRPGAGLPGPCRHRLHPIGRRLGDERQLERTRRDRDRRNPVHAPRSRAVPADLARPRRADRGLPAELGDGWQRGTPAGLPRLRRPAPNPRGSSGRGRSSRPRSSATWAARTPTTTCPESTP